jgi:glycosyltransferase involved in cell wall biosynthesis
MSLSGAEAKKFRLAFLLPDMRGGGAERVALTLINDFVGRGQAVDLVLMQAEGELLPLVPPSVRVIDLKARRFRHAVLAIASYLRREKPDGIQVSMWSFTIAGILAHRLSRSRARLVTSDHAPLSKQYQHYGVLRRSFMKWSIRLAYPLADARIVVAQDAADDIARLSGLRRRAFEVVHNPVPAMGPAQNPAVDVDAIWGGPGPRILNVGQMKPQKNHKLLLDAFARFAAGRDARLLILGDGPLRADCERHAAQLGIAGRVTMPGFMAELTPFYRSADLFVLSSDYEGYPLVLIEAMRCGLPIASTDCVSGPAEILGRGQFGRLVPCGDAARLAEAMTEALAIPPDSERLKARAECLSGAHTAERYFELMTGTAVGEPF